jgi:hypothetical protein
MSAMAMKHLTLILAGAMVLALAAPTFAQRTAFGSWILSWQQRELLLLFQEEEMPCRVPET